MAQYDVYENPNPETRSAVPYLLDVQADLLAPLATRVVVPLRTVAAMGGAAHHLNPGFTVGGTPVVMSTAELAGVPQKALGAKVSSLKDKRDDILAALDFLFTGF